MRLLVTISLIAAVVFSAGCKKDKDDDDDSGFPPLDQGDVQTNRAWLIYTEAADTTQKDTFELFDDPNAISDTIKLERAKNGNSFKNFSQKTLFFNGSQEVTGEIASRANSYVVCYRDQDPDLLRLTDRDTDSQGKYVGLDNRWTTLDVTGSGTMRVTMNYQQEKSDLCDPGVRIFDAEVPYKIIN